MKSLKVKLTIPQLNRLYFSIGFLAGVVFMIALTFVVLAFRGGV